MNRAAWLILASAVALLACDTGLAPPSLIENLRVLGMRATPEQLRPGETAFLQALVVDPSRPGKAGTVLWLGCDPDPFNLNRSACSDPAILTDPSSLTGGTGTLPPGVKIIGFNAQAAYKAPATVFDVLPPGDVRREIGTVGQVIAFAVAEEVSPSASMEELKALFDRVQSKEVRSIISLYRIRISEGTERNADPQSTRFLVGGEPLPTGAHITVMPGEPVVLDVEVDDTVFENYVQVSEAGREDKTERVLVNWYATMGRFSFDRTTVREDVKTIYTAAGVKMNDPVPESRRGFVYTVLRDTRGGQWWAEYPLFVCDKGSTFPTIARVSGGGSIATPVTIQGENLDALLEVIIDGVALRDGRASADATSWTGILAKPLAAGTWPVAVKTRACQKLSGVTLTVQ